MMACGKNLFLSLFVLVLMDLYHQPEGNRSNRWCAGRVLSLVNALVSKQDEYKSLKEGRG